MASAKREKLLSNVRAVCLGLPEAVKVEAWRHPTFRAGKKMFAAFGGEGNDLTIGMKVGFDRQEELLKDERFFPTPYAAHQGWVSLRLDGAIDWVEVDGLVREANRQVALKRMLKALEG
jgi:predicted DNA-binding protein (MmcQ/YjbR family)